MPAATKAEILLEERLRIADILESPQGLAHPKTARELALRSSMSPSQVRSVLANLPAESPFLDAMNKEAIGVTPATIAATGFVGSDPKEARRKEIRQASRSTNLVRGYVSPEAKA